MHHCQSILIHCIDFRLQPTIKRWLEEEQLLGDHDIVSVAGAAKDIAEGGEFVLKQIDIAYRLHGVRRVILMNHTDCGAYGGRQANDLELHTTAMQAAAERIKQTYSDMTVRFALADIAANGGVTINFLEV